MLAAPRLVSVPRSAGERLGLNDRSASAFAYVSETPPGAGRATCRCPTTNPTMEMAVTATPAHKTGRHRGDGSDPVGKTRSMNASPATIGTKITSENAPTTVPAGTEPGWVRTPTTA